MEIEMINRDFTVCKVEDYSLTDPEQEFCFIGRTDEEKSLVCVTEHVPENTVERTDGWKAFRVRGVLDFALIGILAKISSLMAGNGISIFAVSTYNTDYILVKRENYDKASKVLADAGYRMIRQQPT